MAPQSYTRSEAPPPRRPRVARIALATLGLVALALSLGCAATQLALPPRDLARVQAEAPIIVYTADDRVYRLTRHTLADSAIAGSGTVRHQGATSPFEGSIPLASVVAVGASTRSGVEKFVRFGVTALLGVAVFEGLGRHHSAAHVDSATHFPSGTGIGTSCPYVYAWNGSRYVLQAEPFGIAWGRALELTTTHLLPAARADRGVLRLRLANERSEIHYIESVRLRRIDLDGAPAAVLDGDGTAWAWVHPQAPQSARDDRGRDLRGDVCAADGRMWERDAAELTPGSGYADVIELSFAHPTGATTALLAVTGINTELSSAFYDELCRAMGDRTPALAHAVETNPELIAELRGYVADASLAASVWNGREWEAVGALAPEANAVAFTRALRLRVPAGAGDTVRVRLRALADVWRLDAVAIDWSPAHPLTATPLALRGATGPGGEDARDALTADDDRRIVLLPGDRVELSFDAPTLPRGGAAVYAVAARGFLHEWNPRSDVAEPAALEPGTTTGQRIASIVALLHRRDVALPVVYERWRSRRAP